MSASQADTVLQGLRAAGDLDDLDLHFARLMTRMAVQPSVTLAVAAAAASQATGEGHVCTDLTLLAVAAASAGVEQTDARALRDTLLVSGVATTPGGFAPLVLDDAGRLYLWRYHDWQQRVARALVARVEDAADVDEDLLRDGLARVFPAQAGQPGADRQRLAAAVAVLKRLAVISGGPGTGKTTTVARILALLTEQALARSPARAPRVVLAAPTGKAAAKV